MCDVGLLRRKAKVDASIILSDNKDIYKEFKGAITENFVLLELISINNEIPYYWTSGNTAEVDFIWQLEEKIIPFEVKSGVNVKSKSLSLYINKYNPKIEIRTSMKNIEKQNKILNIPLYLLWNLKKYIKQIFFKLNEKFSYNKIKKVISKIRNNLIKIKQKMEKLILQQQRQMKNYIFKLHIYQKNNCINITQFINEKCDYYMQKIQIK